MKYAWINKYLFEARPSYSIEPDDGYLFLTQYGTGMSPVWLGVTVRKYIKAAEIEKKGACHLFRHSMATHMLEGGADIRYIQHMLGHSDLTSTQIYTRVSIKKLKEVHNKTHPGAKLKPVKQSKE